MENIREILKNNPKINEKIIQINPMLSDLDNFSFGLKKD